MISGDWCPSYIQRLENKYTKGKITEDKYKSAKEFIITKIANIQKLQSEYEKMTSEEKTKFRFNLEKLKNEMCGYFLKIINGRINSFRLRSSAKNIEHIDDIVQDAYITVMSYINRYNDELATSAFAYVTQLATNSILYSLKEINERDEKLVTGLDFFENLNTLDSIHDTDNLSKFIE